MTNSPTIYHIIDDINNGNDAIYLVTMVAEAKHRFPFNHRVLVIGDDGAGVRAMRGLGIDVEVLALNRNIRWWQYRRVIRDVRTRIRTLQPIAVEGIQQWSRYLGLWAAYKECVPCRAAYGREIQVKGLRSRLSELLVRRFATSLIMWADLRPDEITPEKKQPLLGPIKRAFGISQKVTFSLDFTQRDYLDKLYKAYGLTS